jgi:hypothetical protein
MIKLQLYLAIILNYYTSFQQAFYINYLAAIFSIY